VRVAILTTSYPRSPGDAAGHFVRAEARALCAAGHDVWVFAPGAEAVVEPGAPRVVWLASGKAFGSPGAAARLRENPLRGAAALAYLARAGSALKERGPFERVVAHWLVPSGFPLALVAGPDTELELVAHGSDVRLLARFPSVARWVLGTFVARSATVRCVSHELATELVALEPRLAPLLRVEACPIDLPALDRAAARRRHHAGSAPLIVVAARLVPGKRVEVALRSATLVPGARCVVLGDGPERAALEQAFSGVEFLGSVPRDVCLQWLAAADLVLGASRLEGAPSVVREARLLGTKVVACASGDLAAWAADDAALWILVAAASSATQRAYPLWPR
jgi:teichuronic acid biosynthesis glycosyltransferase TuaC